MRAALQIGLARGHRREPTASEALLWESLRDRSMDGLRFRRQHPVQFTRFIADSCCVAIKLIVEIDGGYHNELEQAKRDREREMMIAERGYTFVRISDTDVVNNLPLVLQTIQNTARNLVSKPNIFDASTPPSPAERGRGVGAPKR
ncbi:MAG: endonuclease domain-containing protein [Akkermansiaceae bacterium]|nr:endonuclease domain-containing protein [Armatimonadota bacterium]